MPVRSKWQSLPTEQINPATLNIDKLASVDIVEGMLNEDRKMIAAVQREKERIAVGVEIITQALRKNGRVVFIGGGPSLWDVYAKYIMHWDITRLPYDGPADRWFDPKWLLTGKGRPL